MAMTVLGIAAPEKACTDGKCPFHGKLSVTKELFRGKIVRKDLNRTATIEWHKSHYLPKYERYEIRRHRLRVHNPGCLDAAVGEEVLAAKTRPLSKTKHHVIIQKIAITKTTTERDANTKKST